MIYIKHPTLGNRHVTEDESVRLVAEGWVRFPRSAEEKARGPFAAPPAGGFRSSPPVVDTPKAGAAPSTVEDARKALDAKGIKYDGRWKLPRLLELL